jgi:hypothetical protein
MVGVLYFYDVINTQLFCINFNISMKQFFLLILFFSSFVYSCPTIAQDQIDKNHYLDNTTRDLSSVAKWAKNFGRGSYDKLYEYFVTNRSTLHEVITYMTIDGVAYNWHFYDSGLFTAERSDNSRKTLSGQWGAVNSENIKIYAQWLERPNEILFYESQTNNIFSQIQPEQASVSKTPSKPPITSTNPSKANILKTQIALGLDTRTTGGSYYDWRYKPEKCRHCHGSGIVKVCWNCEKRGYRYCWYCGGKQYNRDGSVCINCAGKGVVTCPYCRGKVSNFKCLHWFIPTWDALSGK